MLFVIVKNPKKYKLQNTALKNPTLPINKKNISQQTNILNANMFLFYLYMLPFYMGLINQKNGLS